MTQKICSLDHLIDQIDIPETDRTHVKMQINRAESIVDAVEACCTGVRKLLKPLAQLKVKSAHQH